MDRIVRVGLGLSVSLGMVLSVPRLVARAEQYGPEDFRISFSGPDDSDRSGARQPAVTYNSDAREFFVVWSAITTTTTVTTTVTREDIMGQRVAAETGQLRGAPVLLSRVDPNPLLDYASSLPAVVYNPDDRRYLVVWNRSVRTSTSASSWLDGRFVDGATGAALGIDSFRLGAPWPPSGFMIYDTEDRVALAYSSRSHRYIVGGPGWTEKYGSGVTVHFVNSDGGVTRSLFDIRSALPGGVPSAGDLTPGLAYNATADEVLVTWLATTTAFLYERGPAFVYAQRVDVAGQRTLGGPQLIAGDLSTSLAVEGDSALLETRPGLPIVAYQAGADRYLVAWVKSKQYTGNYGPVLARWLGSDGVPLGPAQPLPMPGACQANHLGRATSSAAALTAVVWSTFSEGGNAGCVSGMQAWGQWLRDPQAAPMEPAEQLSHVGPFGSSVYRATWPAAAIGASPAQVLTVWSGNEEGPGLHPDKLEIYGQLASTLTTRLMLPGLQREDRPVFAGGAEVEPNNSAVEANGPLISGRTALGYANDGRDYFSFIVSRAGAVSIDLSAITASDVQLQLLDQGLNRVGYDGDSPYRIDLADAAPGRYYAYIVVGGNFNTTTPYQLRVTFP